MRIDKYLSTLEFFSRRQSASLIRKWYFSVNNELVFDRDYELNDGDMLGRDGHQLEVKTTVTLLINKPAWYISSDENEHGWPSYKQLLDAYPYTAMVHIAWRLDVDTEWLILATSDGQLNHRIISPKHHLPKTYLVTTRDPVTPKQLDRLRGWVILDDGYKTLPAEASLRDDGLLQLILTEGKFHQVKRMLLAVGNEVTHLKRIAIGSWTLEQLGKNRFIELSYSEIWLALGQKIST